MFCYVHGFNSGAGSNSGRLLEEALRLPVFRPEYDSSRPFKENLESLLFQCRELSPGSVLMGSSLGAFMAYRLSGLLRLNCVLFNPVVRPFEDLEQFLGMQTNFSTGKTYAFTREVLESYRGAEVEKTGLSAEIFVSDRDEVLRDNVARVRSAYAGRIHVIHTPHSLDDYKPYVPYILPLCGRSAGMCGEGGGQ